MRVKTIAGLAAFCFAAACGGEIGEEPGVPAPALDEPVNLDVWLERLEVSSRELYSARGNVVAALELQKGARIADVGAGTGLHTLMFAEQVGPAGVVYAVDIAPRFLTLINQRADDLGFENVVAVLSRPDSVTLPQGSVDVVFIADTYHYFDNPEAIMKTIHEALRPGGALYLVEFKLAEGEARTPEKRHVRFGEAALIAEIESFGFSFEGDLAVDGLADNYMVKFTRP